MSRTEVYTYENWALKRIAPRRMNFDTMKEPWSRYFENEFQWRTNTERDWVHTEAVRIIWDYPDATDQHLQYITLRSPNMLTLVKTVGLVERYKADLQKLKGKLTAEAFEEMECIQQIRVSFGPILRKLQDEQNRIVDRMNNAVDILKTRENDIPEDPGSYEYN